MTRSSIFPGDKTTGTSTTTGSTTAIKVSSSSSSSSSSKCHQVIEGVVAGMTIAVGSIGDNRRRGRQKLGMRSFFPSALLPAGLRGLSVTATIPACGTVVAAAAAAAVAQIAITAVGATVKSQTISAQFTHRCTVSCTARTPSRVGSTANHSRWTVPQA